MDLLWVGIWETKKENNRLLREPSWFFWPKRHTPKQVAPALRSQRSAPGRRDCLHSKKLKRRPILEVNMDPKAPLHFAAWREISAKGKAILKTWARARTVPEPLCSLEKACLGEILFVYRLSGKLGRSIMLFPLIVHGTPLEDHGRKPGNEMVYPEPCKESKRWLHPFMAGMLPY